MLGIVANILKILSGESANWQLATAVVWGMLLALLPTASLQFFVCLLLLCLLRINIGFCLIAVPVFALLKFALVGPAIGIGESLLLSPDWQATWTSLYQYDWFRMTRLNHTEVLGLSVFALVLALPVYLLALVLIKQYRANVLTWFNKLHLVKVLKTSEFYQLFITLKD